MCEEQHGRISFEEKMSECPIKSVLDVIGGKWNYQVLLSLSDGCKRFCELLKCLNGISPKTLSSCLKELEKRYIVKKTVYPVIPLHVEYELTQKGNELQNIFKEMKIWGEKWNREIKG